MTVTFDFEESGCQSCGKLIGAALSRVGTVERIDIDEEAGLATVVLAGTASRDSVAAALVEASAGAGHDYRVRDGSWRTVG